jgi:outer membrane protein
LVPNVRFAVEGYDFDTKALSDGFEFDNEVYNMSFDTTFNGSETTGTFYYELLDNVVSLDAGLSIKNIDVDVEFNSDVNAGTAENINIWLPTLYVSAEAYVPFAGVTIGGMVETVSYDGNDVTVVDAYIGYEVLDLVAADVMVKVGYKARDIKIDDVEDFTMDLSNESVYASVQVHF